MPAEFQQAMDRTPGNQKGVFAFIDDVLIVSKGSKEEHEELVRNTSRKMDKQGMPLKLEKCTSGRHEIEWLGYKITQKGIKPLKGKVESIQNQERPRTIKQLRSLLGAAHQLNRFINGLAKICHRFRIILSKEKEINSEIIGSLSPKHAGSQAPVNCLSVIPDAEATFAIIGSILAFGVPFGTSN